MRDIEVNSSMDQYLRWHIESISLIAHSGLQEVAFSTHVQIRKKVATDMKLEYRATGDNVKPDSMVSMNDYLNRQLVGLWKELTSYLFVDDLNLKAIVVQGTKLPKASLLN